MAKSNNAKQEASAPLIAGIGASAGAIDTLGAFFEEISDSPGLAFVVVIHLSPDHTSSLPDLISRHTSLPAVAAEDGQQVEENRIYVIPPDSELALMNGALHLMPRQDRRPWLPIDSFFRSLAGEAGDHAIAVVLSGTGSDGSLGLQAVKAQLGLTMAQSPESAAFPGMPQAAIDHGVVDYVSTPKGLATEILDYASHFAKRR